MDICNRRTIRHGIVAAAALIFTQVLTSHVMAADDYTVGSLHITQPWARATPKGAANGAGYMTVTNNGTTAARLNCVSSDAAAKCQIHEMSMDGGVMKMRPVAGGLEIKPGETVTLKPGGYHVMLVDIKQPLEPGKTIAATFKVDNGGTVQVDFPIAAIGAPAPGASTGGPMMMQGPGMKMDK
jgi:periplasmic copper chaperone A